MKRLYLLRHAKSSWDEPELADRDRPLAPRGQRAAKLMGRHLRERDIAPDLVLCSSSARTRETLERLDLAEGSEPLLERGLYAASMTELLDRLRAVPDSLSSVLLIGHNPGIEELALALARESGGQAARMQRKFPTAALATLEFEGSWSALAPESAELLSFVRPKDLKAD